MKKSEKGKKSKQRKILIHNLPFTVSHRIEHLLENHNVLNFDQEKKKILSELDDYEKLINNLEMISKSTQELFEEKKQKLVQLEEKKERISKYLSLALFQ
jgi:valyl-tRNA synthetase